MSQPGHVTGGLTGSSLATLVRIDFSTSTVYQYVAHGFQMKMTNQRQFDPVCGGEQKTMALPRQQLRKATDRFSPAASFCPGKSLCN